MDHKWDKLLSRFKKKDIGESKPYDIDYDQEAEAWRTLLMNWISG